MQKYIPIMIFLFEMTMQVFQREIINLGIYKREIMLILGGLCSFRRTYRNTNVAKNK